MSQDSDYRVGFFLYLCAYDSFVNIWTLKLLYFFNNMHYCLFSKIIVSITIFVATITFEQQWFILACILHKIRTRFEKINQHFHCNDVSQNPPWRTTGYDKICHVRPGVDEFGDKCVKNYHPFREKSVDEGMIAFKGRLSFKQYLPVKATKFGIKVWERRQNIGMDPKKLFTRRVGQLLS